MIEADDLTPKQKDRIAAWYKGTRPISQFDEPDEAHHPISELFDEDEKPT